MDIFETAQSKGEFAKLKVKGDAVQGTFIDVQFGKDSFDNDQVIYVLKDKEGKIWNVGFKLTNKFIQEQMEKVRFGQIVGFRVDDIVESKQRKGIMVKYIHAYSDIKNVDTAWIAEQTKALASLGTTITEDQARKMNKTGSVASADTTGNWDDEPPFPTSTAPVERVVEHPSAQADNVDETLAAIRTLATNKGLVPAGTIAEVADALIVGFIGVPLTKENYTTAIVKLSAFTK